MSYAMIMSIFCRSVLIAALCFAAAAHAAPVTLSYSLKAPPMMSHNSPARSLQTFLTDPTCDLDTGLKCAEAVKSCIPTCKTGGVAACVECIGADFEPCCPCLKKLDSSLPVQCSNISTTESEFEGLWSEWKHEYKKGYSGEARFLASLKPRSSISSLPRPSCTYNDTTNSMLARMTVICV